jgi:DnaJ-class molecular chaperone
VGYSLPAFIWEVHMGIEKLPSGKEGKGELENCPRCNGTGKGYGGGDKCGRCNGTGKIPSAR